MAARMQIITLLHWSQGLLVLVASGAVLLSDIVSW